MSRRWAGVALIPLVAIGCGARIPREIAPAQAPQAVSRAVAAPEEPTVQQWIRSNAIPLATVEAGHGFADMEPLRKIVGDARIVSLGESTHGTRECFQMKHRMLEFLATQMGFSIFSIEANMPEASRVNDYVLSGTGNPTELLKGLTMWPWDTREVLDMIGWMREFNKSGKGPIEFTGFDMQMSDMAERIVVEFVGKYDPGYLPLLQKTPAVTGATNPRSTSYTGLFPAGEAAGKTLRLSANIKTQGVTGYAGLFFWRADGKVDGKTQGTSFKNLGDAAPKGTTGWKRYAVEMAVPVGTKTISFGTILDGGGAAWFDGIDVEVDGRPYTKAGGFEIIEQGRARPKGAFPAAPGYVATFESKESSGAPGPALEIRRMSPMSDAPTAGKLNEIAGQWQQVLKHMESSRDAYLAKGAAAKDTDWATQNARIVIQSIQMRMDGSVRDPAMAQNVKWILDHSKGRKIVLWAHNGHLMTVPNSKAMGSELRSLYGSQMVVFAFAFNQGSFRAVERNKGLHVFTLGPAREGSFEATLASSGIRLFALDLRRTAGAAAAEWVKERQKMRSVGVFYSDDSAERIYFDRSPIAAYDAVLFADSTTPTLPNPPLSK